MKRIVISIIVALLFVSSISAKTTYIPIYRSYIHIVNGTDTSAVSNNLMDLETADENGMFKIYIEHEDVTKEKVKAIKRAKRTAGWATFSAVMSGISTAFSRNSLQYMIRSTTTRIDAQLADIYNKNAQAENEGKIAELENQVRHAKIIDESEVDTKTVQVGNRVKILDMEYGDELEYTIVGSTEVDLAKNRISNESPIGAALLGSKKNQEIEVEVPAGKVKYKIISITK